MKFTRFFPLALWVLSWPVAAHDIAPDYADLTLKNPAAKSEYLIDGADWTCKGAICHADVVDDMPVLWSCQRIVEETGAVTSFTYRGKALDDAGIAACNTKARF